MLKIWKNKIAQNKTQLFFPVVTVQSTSNVTTTSDQNKCCVHYWWMSQWTNKSPHCFLFRVCHTKNGNRRMSFLSLMSVLDASDSVFSLCWYLVMLSFRSIYILLLSGRNGVARNFFTEECFFLLPLRRSNVALSCSGTCWFFEVDDVAVNKSKTFCRLRCNLFYF